MILVTVGTTNFDALVRRVDELAPELGEEVVCQIGGGAYVPQHCKWLRFAPSLAELLGRARLVVTHGGQGSILEALRAGKPVVGVSNQDRRDRHQDDILGRFESDQHLIWCRSLDDLGACIARASATSLRPYVEPECRIHLVIADFLRRRSTRSRRPPLRGAA